MSSSDSHDRVLQTVYEDEGPKKITKKPSLTVSEPIDEGPRFAEKVKNKDIAEGIVMLHQSQLHVMQTLFFKVSISSFFITDQIHVVRVRISFLYVQTF